MFIYIDFKMKIIEGDFEAAKKMLADVEIDAETFNALSNASMFLSLAFRYPDEDVYDTLKDNWDAFQDFIADYSDSKIELYNETEMESDYIKLFEQDMEGNKIVPYISYFTEDNKMLYGKSTFNIREWMSDEGFVLEEDVTDLEDHVYIVLEFMSAIFKKLAAPENIENWYKSLQNLYKVLDNYGPVLSDSFAALVSKRDDMPFYRDFAKILAEFVKDIDPIMEDILTEGGE